MQPRPHPPVQPGGVAWVVACRMGLGGVLACWAVRKSKCHRFVPDAVDREVNRMASEQAIDEARSPSAADEAPPLIARGVADMAAVSALGGDDDD